MLVFFRFYYIILCTDLQLRNEFLLHIVSMLIVNELLQLIELK